MKIQFIMWVLKDKLVEDSIILYQDALIRSVHEEIETRIKANEYPLQCAEHIEIVLKQKQHTYIADPNRHSIFLSNYNKFLTGIESQPFYIEAELPDDAVEVATKFTPIDSIIYTSYIYKFKEDKNFKVEYITKLYPLQDTYIYEKNSFKKSLPFGTEKVGECYLENPSRRLNLIKEISWDTKFWEMNGALPPSHVNEISRVFLASNKFSIMQQDQAISRIATATDNWKQKYFPEKYGRDSITQDFYTAIKEKDYAKLLKVKEAIEAAKQEHYTPLDDGILGAIQDIVSNKNFWQENGNPTFIKDINKLFSPDNKTDKLVLSQAIVAIAKKNTSWSSRYFSANTNTLVNKLCSAIGQRNLAMLQEVQREINKNKPVNTDQLPKSTITFDL